MAAIHEALKALSPTTFADVPTSTPELTSYLSSTFDNASLLVDSVPPPPPPPSTSLTPETSRPRSTSSASAVSLSSARSAPAAPDRESLQSSWGKPVKLSAKENPLSVSVYKLAGQDGKGAWFGRRSVHEGLGFEAWRDGLRKELPMGWSEDEPGGMVRSIKGEKVVEEKEVEGAGKMEVYHLTAQFPGPAAPRDFVTLLLTGSGAEEEGGPRHFMVVSKPCQHESCPPKSGTVRGQYESVEFIREVPRKTSRKAASAVDLPSAAQASEETAPDEAKSGPSDKSKESGEKLRSGGKTISFADPLEDGSGLDSAGPPAIEWIHVTRSDPGGNVPRFMVDRGTPGGICSDASKFVNWLSTRNAATDGASSEVDEEGAKDISNGNADSSVAPAESAKPTSDRPPSTLFQTATSLATSTLEHYAPRALTDRLNLSPKPPDDDDVPSSPSSISSGSFASAEDFGSSPSPSGKSTVSTAQPAAADSPEERATARLAKKRADLEAKLAKAREGATRDKASTTEREAGQLQKAREKHEREMAKAEEAHAKELKGLREKREKEERKEERRQEKARQKEEQAREKREREDVRRQLGLVTKERDALKKENERLVGEKERLEKENVELKGTAEVGEKGD